MNLTDADKDRINKAAEHINHCIALAVEKMAGELKQTFGVSGAHLNVAVAKAAITTMATCAAAAASSRGDSEDEVAEAGYQIAQEVESILYAALGVRS